MNKKKDLEEKLRDFADGVIIGSNFILRFAQDKFLKEWRLIFSAENAISDYLKLAPYSSWWSLYEFVRNCFKK